MEWVDAGGPKSSTFVGAPVYAVATRDPSALRGAYLEKSTPVDVSAAVADEQVGRWLHEYCEERLAQWGEK